MGAGRTEGGKSSLGSCDATGGFGRFQLVESPVMARELAAQYPEIKTYAGQGVDDPTATVRLDWTPAGFHALILTANGAIYIDPYQRNDTTHYISYFKRDLVEPATKEFTELPVLVPDATAAARRAELVAQGVSRSSGTQLRTYRLAVAATGEYTQFHGGTVGNALAAIVTTVNRVNAIYERDVAVRMVLVANNNAIIYTNGATDPYTNNDGIAMLDENQSNLDSVIGSANYDIGHVFSTGGGGIAYLGVPCRNSWKAGGVTGSSAPVGDPFDIDYVAHEMGHQFGANHTFNGTSGACSGNRNGPTAYEPGSGSTIMAYAGICGSQNIQANSDADFHTISFDEIVVYTTQDSGNNCPVITATGNQPPVADAGPGGYTIPGQTPFMLTGTATDPDGDPLTYEWEEFDLGSAGAPNNATNPPFFRSFLPTTNPSRAFPRWADLVNNTTTIGEILPNTTRTMTFRFTVRDNRSGGGGVDYDTTTVNVTSAAGPFRVTAPNTGIAWAGGSSQTVTWDVAGTNGAPINCPTVNLRLSTDGGYTYPTTLANNVSNNGSTTITVPQQATTAARVQVACANNIFFDISNVNFTITSNATPTMTPTPGTPTITPTPTATGTPTLTPTTTPTTPPTPTITPGPNCSIYNSTDVPVGIFDGSIVDSTLTVPGSITPTDVNLRGLRVRHSWVSDLTIVLRSPNGTTVTLFDEQGDSGDDLWNTDFDDGAATPISAGSAPFTGSYRPEESLSAFQGNNAGGQWQLEITDSYLEDTGQLEGWALELCGAATPTPTATATPTATPIAGDGNGDGVVNAGDISACVLEIFDGDGNLPGDAPGGSYSGTAGCDANQDVQINAGDITCIVLLIFNGPGACTTPAQSNAPTAAGLPPTHKPLDRLFGG